MRAPVVAAYPVVFGYSIREEVANDEPYVFSRAVRDHDGTVVLAKWLRPEARNPVALAALARELLLFAGIDGKGLPRAVQFRDEALILEAPTAVPVRQVLHRIVGSPGSAPRYAFVSESISEMESRSLAYWEGTEFGEGFSYRFPGTPCQRVAQGHICSTATRLQELFPEDLWLQQIGVDSYVGVPMKTADGRVLGHIAVLHTERMEPTSEDIAVLRIFASRGCAELARVQADRALREALKEVQRLKDRLEAENVYLQEEIQNEHNFEEMVGQSPSLKRLLEQIDSVAATDATVLVEGETGSGKELVARALHAKSARKGRPLVKVNCGALPPGLVESELFGHAKGAFTGAFQKRVGRFELADGGTLFLDEIGELPLDAQAKLLRALQEQEIEPVGSNDLRRVDVRVIAATNRNLGQAIQEGRFRADLFYRLHVIPIAVPPLRDRVEDIPQLSMYFLDRAAKKAGKPIRGIATSTLERLSRYAWPGNVRELENVIERAVILSSGPVLEVSDDATPSGRAFTTKTARVRKRQSTRPAKDA